MQFVGVWQKPRYRETYATNVVHTVDDAMPWLCGCCKHPLKRHCVPGLVVCQNLRCQQFRFVTKEPLHAR